jgi:hypothetical protein
MYILDSSAIAIVLKRLREKAIEVLNRKTTLDKVSLHLKP